MEYPKERMKFQGEACWADLYSDDADATIKFLSDNFDIEVVNGSRESDIDYKIIKSKEGSFPYAGVVDLDEEHKNKGVVPHAIVYLTVKNYDEMHEKFIKSGAKPIAENMFIEDMKLKYGVYIIPGGLDIGIVELNAKR